MRRLLARDDKATANIVIFTELPTSPRTNLRFISVHSVLLSYRGRLCGGVFGFASSLAKRRRAPRGGEMPGPVLEVIEPQ